MFSLSFIPECATDLTLARSTERVLNHATFTKFYILSFPVDNLRYASPRSLWAMSVKLTTSLGNYELET